MKDDIDIGALQVKVHFDHGTYTLLCDADSHAVDGMEITINVGGIGQVG